MTVKVLGASGDSLTNALLPCVQVWDHMHVYIKVFLAFLFYVKSMSDRWDPCQVRERVYPDVACGAVVQILSFYFLFRIFNHFYLLNHTVIFEIFYIFEFVEPRALE